MQVWREIRSRKAEDLLEVSQDRVAALRRGVLDWGKMEVGRIFEGSVERKEKTEGNEHRNGTMERCREGKCCCSRAVM